MNPADQERKAARRKELKKNKKTRGLVRSAVLKSKDADDLISQMQKLDQMEFEAHTPASLRRELYRRNGKNSERLTCASFLCTKGRKKTGNAKKCKRNFGNMT